MYNNIVRHRTSRESQFFCFFLRHHQVTATHCDLLVDSPGKFLIESFRRLFKQFLQANNHGALSRTFHPFGSGILPPGTNRADRSNTNTIHCKY